MGRKYDIYKEITNKEVVAFFEKNLNTIYEVRGTFIEKDLQNIGSDFYLVFKDASIKRYMQNQELSGIKSDLVGFKESELVGICKIN